MSDPQRTDRTIEHLHPELRLRLLTFYQETGRRRLGVFITEGYRTLERQAWLHASGRTRPGPILTYAAPGTSYHNLMIHGVPCSAAVDVAVWDEDTPWSKSLEWNGSASEWEIVHAAAQKAGLQTLKFERPHLQLPFPLADLAAGRHWPEFWTPIPSVPEEA